MPRLSLSHAGPGHCYPRKRGERLSQLANHIEKIGSSPQAQGELTDKWNNSTFLRARVVIKHEIY